MKKVSKVNQVKEMLANDPALKVEKVMETMGVKKAYAYKLMADAKAKPKRKYTRTAPTKHDSMVALGKELLKGRNAIDGLLSENRKLNNLLQEQANTITALKIDMLDQQAIINYLEKKLYK